MKGINLDLRVTIRWSFLLRYCFFYDYAKPIPELSSPPLAGSNVQPLLTNRVQEFRPDCISQRDRENFASKSVFAGWVMGDILLIGLRGTETLIVPGVIPTLFQPF
jgi:hypothetical protein